ncbi:MAG TPA: DNA translocase FtsK 4TM domain-containing protein, partial [Ferruginibacter sp.]|nr:DNA translocase FtsK 4TM domain-containing protein [Ferruginibacter sp.]
MAKKQKEKSNTPDQELLKEEKIEQIEVKQLLKDERTHKIVGSIAVLLAIMLFIAFTSYLFTWDEDQDKVFRHGSKLLWGADTHVDNLMGTFGAFISHFFIYKGFGVASYLICTLFFVVGVNLFFGKKIFSIVRNLKYLIIGLPVLSATASVFLGKQSFPWGGAAGDLMANWLQNTIGSIGAYGIIAVTFLAYIIWRFNPDFNFSKQPAQQLVEAQPENIQAATELSVDKAADKKAAKTKETLPLTEIKPVEPETAPIFDLVEKEEPVAAQP